MSETAGLSMTQDVVVTPHAVRALQALLAFACVAVLLAPAFFAAEALAPRSQPVTEVMGVTSGDATPPVGAVAAPVTLPRRRCAPSTEPCFDHFQVSLPSPVPEAVFLPEFAGSVSARFNGVPVARYGTLTPPIARLLFQPVYFELPPHLAEADGNTLTLSVGTDRRLFHQLAPFYVGSAETLRPAWRFAHWLSRDVLVWSCGVYLVLVLIALLTVAIAGRAPLFGWLSLIALSATARNVFFLWTDPNYDTLRLFLYYAASLTLPMACLAFTARLVEHKTARWLAWAPLAVIPVLLWMGWEVERDAYWGLFRADTFTRVATLVVGIPTIYLITRYMLRAWHPLKPWVAALFAGAFVLTLHDVQAGLRGTDIKLQLSNLAPLPVVLAFCLMLAQQYGGALREVRLHNRRLRAAVRARERELVVLHEQASDAARREAVSSERERILRDMHDGVGGRLAGLIMMARRRGQDDMERHLEESLSDLRWIMDSIDDNAAQTLSELLEHLRERVDPWLIANGVTPHWQLSLEHASQTVRPRWRLELYRLLQEAFNNVVRHARATRVDIEAEATDTHLTLCIRDNGRGFAPDSEPGRGLRHLSERANRLGGTCTIDSTPGGGTLVVVTTGIMSADATHESGGDAPRSTGLA